MKVLIINSVYGFSSTGRICAEIAKEAQKKGDICMIACREARQNKDDKSEIVIISSPVQTKIHGVQARLFDNQGLNSNHSTKAFLKIADAFNPDVVWLHNIHGYYINYDMLFTWIKSKSNLQVKWTLHDCWAFTGHCAYFTMCGCERWKRGCFDCPQIREYPKSLFFDNSRRNYLLKKKSFCGVSDLEIITPSKWLAGLVKESFLSEYSVLVVHNKIDTSVFKPTKQKFRRDNNLVNQRIVLGVANKWGRRKGLDRFVTIAEKLPDYFTVILIGEITEEQRRALPKNTLALGKTNNTHDLADIYSSADVLLLLTREDNYPTVSLEAEACGTPVFTLDVGGCKETIHRIDSKAVKSTEEIFELLLKSFPKREEESST